MINLVEENIFFVIIEFYYEFDKNCLGFNLLICKFVFFFVNMSVMVKYFGL